LEKRKKEDKVEREKSSNIYQAGGVSHDRRILKSVVVGGTKILKKSSPRLRGARPSPGGREAQARERRGEIEKTMKKKNVCVAQKTGPRGPKTMTIGKRGVIKRDRDRKKKTIPRPKKEKIRLV